MNRLIKPLFALTLTVSLLSNSYSQDIDKIAQTEIIEKLKNEIKSTYPDKEKAIKIDNALNKLKGKVQETVSIDDFSGFITSVLVETSGDKHFNLYYNPEKFVAFSQNDSIKIKYTYEVERPINFGFRKVEILTGNIGYINIDLFTRLVGEVAGGLAASAINLVGNTDALIIDMRHNGGGDGRMSEYFRTYFFPEAGFTYYDSISKQEIFFTASYVPGKRYLNKPVYILIGKGTFSAAEDFSYFMRKFRNAVLVGESTLGGGPGGGSVPLVHNFLCFIPTDLAVYEYEFERIGVKPDYPFDEEKAFEYAQYLILKSRKKDYKTEEEREKGEWNLSTMEYLLKLTKTENEEFDKDFIGNYEMGRTIFLKDNRPFLKAQGKEFYLKKIREKEYVLENDERFGQCNSRLILIKEGNEIIIDHKVFGSIIHNKTFKKIK